MLRVSGLSNLSQCMMKPIKRRVRPAKTLLISLRIRAVWSEASLVACAFYSLWDIQRGLNEDPCLSGWMYRLIWVFAGHTGLIVGFVMRWLIIRRGIPMNKFTLFTQWKYMLWLLNLIQPSSYAFLWKQDITQPWTKRREQHYTSRFRHY